MPRSSRIWSLSLTVFRSFTVSRAFEMLMPMSPGSEKPFLPFGA